MNSSQRYLQKHRIMDTYCRAHNALISTPTGRHWGGPALSRKRLGAIAIALTLGSAMFTSCGQPAAQQSTGNEPAVAREASGVQDCLQPGSSCPGKDFTGMDLSGTNFTGSNLSGAVFNAAKLSNANFTAADLRGASFESLTCEIPYQQACIPDLGQQGFSSIRKITTSVIPHQSGIFSGAERKDRLKYLHLEAPRAVATAPDSQTVYIGDTGNRRIISARPADDRFQVIAGNGRICTFNASRCGDGGNPADAQFGIISALTTSPDGSVLYIADADAHVVRAVNLAENTISTVAGDGRLGFTGDGGNATDAELGRPVGLAATQDSLYIADSLNNNVRAVNLSDSAISTVAGSATGKICPKSDDLSCLKPTATASKLRAPGSISLDAQGNLLIAQNSAASLLSVAPDGSLHQAATKNEIHDVGLLSFYHDGTLLAGGDNQPLRIVRPDAYRAWTSSPDKADLLNDAEVIKSATLPQFGAGVLAPDGRYAAITDPAKNRVQMTAPEMGPDLSGATFANSQLGPDWNDKADSFIRSAKFSGIDQPDLTVDAHDMTWAYISHSRFAISKNTPIGSQRVDDSSINLTGRSSKSVTSTRSEKPEKTGLTHLTGSLTAPMNQFGHISSTRGDMVVSVDVEVNSEGAPVGGTMTAQWKNGKGTTPTTYFHILQNGIEELGGFTRDKQQKLDITISPDESGKTETVDLERYFTRARDDLWPVGPQIKPDQPILLQSDRAAASFVATPYKSPEQLDKEAKIQELEAARQNEINQVVAARDTSIADAREQADAAAKKIRDSSQKTREAAAEEAINSAPAGPFDKSTEYQEFFGLSWMDATQREELGVTPEQFQQQFEQVTNACYPGTLTATEQKFLKLAEYSTEPACGLWDYMTFATYTGLMSESATALGKRVKTVQAVTIPDPDAEAQIQPIEDAYHQSAEQTNAEAQTKIATINDTYNQKIKDLG